MMLKKMNFKRNTRCLLVQLVLFAFLSASTLTAQCITTTDFDDDGILDFEENGLKATSLTSLFCLSEMNPLSIQMK